MVLGLLSLLTASADGTIWPDLSQPPAVGGGEKDAAVVVVIEDYLQVGDIPGAHDNGLDWYTFLTEGRGISPGRVKLLTNQSATREGIETAVTNAVSKVEPGGTLWFVFIGHGAPGRGGEDGVLVGWDTQQNAASVYARGLPQSELITALEAGKQERTVAVLDACFSGQGASGALVNGLMPMIPTYTLDAGSTTTILSAGGSDEFAGPLPGADRPAFSYLALGGLFGWADHDSDGTVSAQEVTDYTSGALSAMPINRSQTPTLIGPGADWSLGPAAQEGPRLSRIRRALEEGTHVDMVTPTATARTVTAAQTEATTQSSAAHPAVQAARDAATDDELWGDAGDYYVSIESLDEATEAYTTALRLDPTDAEWQRKLIALSSVETVFEVLSTNLDQLGDESLGDYGDLLTRHDRADEGCGMYRRALELDPTDSEWIQKVAACDGEAPPTEDDGGNALWNEVQRIQSAAASQWAEISRAVSRERRDAPEQVLAFIDRYYNHTATVGSMSAEVEIPELSQAAYRAARFASAEEDYDTARPYFEYSCSEGYDKACYRLGQLYQVGAGVSRDYQTANQYFQVACQSGRMSACNYLGMNYDQGRGVAQSFETGNQYFLLACEGGFMNSCSNLGISYYNGDGVPRNHETARHYLQMACDGGYESACDNASQLSGSNNANNNNNNNRRPTRSSASTPTEQDAACTSGDAAACYNLAVRFRQGDGVSANNKMAYKYFRAGCSLGHRASCEEM